MSRGLPARRAAYDALVAVEEGDAYSNLAVPVAVADLPDARDRAFASFLAYETIRWTGTLDWALSQVSKRPVERLDPAVLRVLRIGALQLLKSDVPARAAVDTSVDLIRSLVGRSRGEALSGFVNGVLRNLGRRLDDLPWPDPVQQRIEHLALVTAHPAWQVEEVLARLGPDEGPAALAADNDNPGVTLRATADRDALVEELRAVGIDATPGSLTADAVHAPSADPRTLACVEQGRAAVQDEASMFVVESCEVSRGARVLDLCAGPGGKTAHLAALAGAAGKVVAVELHPHRAALVEEAAARLGVGVEVHVGDAHDPPVEAASFDVVLLDAPCTDLGTGRRRPDVRWRRTAADVGRAAAQQRSLLAAAGRLVRPGGRLVYSVCTWTRAETVGVVESAPEGLAHRSSRQLWPHIDDTDGMFVAVFEAEGVAG